MLEEIIRTEGEDDNDYEVPDDETINQMIARSEDEFELFQVGEGRRERDRCEDTKLCSPSHGLILRISYFF